MRCSENPAHGNKGCFSKILCIGKRENGGPDCDIETSIINDSWTRDEPMENVSPIGTNFDDQSNKNSQHDQDEEPDRELEDAHLARYKFQWVLWKKRWGSVRLEVQK